MRTLMDDGHGLVLRTIRRLLVEAAGRDARVPALVVEEIASVDWASLTFVGRRHRLELRLEGDAAALDRACAALDALLPDIEGSDGRHLLAQAGLVACEPAPAGLGAAAQRCVIEALTLEAD
jgi:hypothetical protein